VFEGTPAELSGGPCAGMAGFDGAQLAADQWLLPNPNDGTSAPLVEYGDGSARLDSLAERRP
jgi:hypothetical protein